MEHKTKKQCEISRKIFVFMNSYYNRAHLSGDLSIGWKKVDQCYAQNIWELK